MIRFFFLSFFLIIGCQNSWSIKEKNDFMIRCMKYKPDNQNVEKYKFFCDCLLSESMKSNSSYSRFLNSKSNNLETEVSLKSCIENP